MEEKPLTMEEKVAKLEEKLKAVESTSATGAPMIPPKVLPWLLAGYAALLGVEGTLAKMLGADHLAVMILGLVLVFAAPFLGMASPGLRKAAMVLLVAGVAFSATGCIHLKPGADTKLIACGTDAMQVEVAGVMPDVAKALQGGAVDWEPQLNALVARVGAAALCALNVLVSNLEVGGGAGELPANYTPGPRKLPTSVLLARAYAYQAAHPYQAK